MICGRLVTTPRTTATSSDTVPASRNASGGADRPFARSTHQISVHAPTTASAQPARIGAEYSGLLQQDRDDEREDQDQAHQRDDQVHGRRDPDPTERGRQAGVQGVIDQSDREADEADEPDEQHDHDRVVAEKGEVRVRPFDERRYSEGYRSDRRHERTGRSAARDPRADDDPDRSGQQGPCRGRRT